MILKKSLFVSLYMSFVSLAWASRLEISYKGAYGIEAYELSSTGRIEIVPKNLKAPFGSLWKLLVHSYLIETGENPGPYLCQGLSAEEVFCCEKGKSITMVEALAQSCGLFYEEQLKYVRSTEWKRFWTEKGLFFNWLEKSRLEAKTEIPISEFLEILSQIQKFKSFPRLQSDLFEVLNRGTLKDEISKYGSQLLVKTWTWELDRKDLPVGGAAGWTQEGLPFWVRGQGTSREVMKRESRQILEHLPRLLNYDGVQVEVNFFQRYPIKSVFQLPQKKEIFSGRLSGDIRVEFTNGNISDFNSNGKIELSAAKKIKGIFAIDEYVARVLEREGSVDQPEAAKALTILIRTFLMKQGKKTELGLAIDDTSSYQRVSPSTPGLQALSLARFTRGLILENAQVNYDTHSWLRMKRLSQKGFVFNQILKVLNPHFLIALSRDQRDSDCKRLKMAESYLTQSLSRWGKILNHQSGYEEVKDVHICELRMNKPFSDLKKNRIYLHFDESIQARISLAHEYLHLGFKHHPVTRDELFIEQLAKKITGAQYE